MRLNIQILGNVVGNWIFKSDPERLRAVNEFPPPTCFKSLRRVLGMFAYDVKWIERFAGKVLLLTTAEKFPSAGDSLTVFKSLKTELEHFALHSLESVPFVVERDASDIAISATLNQRRRPVPSRQRVAGCIALRARRPQL